MSFAMPSRCSAGETVDDGVVDELAATNARQYPRMRGYTRRNLFRMRQFVEAYQGQKKVSAAPAQTHPRDEAAVSVLELLDGLQ